MKTESRSVYWPARQSSTPSRSLITSTLRVAILQLLRQMDICMWYFSHLNGRYPLTGTGLARRKPGRAKGIVESGCTSRLLKYWFADAHCKSSASQNGLQAIFFEAAKGEGTIENAFLGVAERYFSRLLAPADQRTPIPLYFLRVLLAQIILRTVCFHPRSQRVTCAKPKQTQGDKLLLGHPRPPGRT
jgi:hypothetical protein